MDREDDEIGECHAGEKQDDARREQRKGKTLFRAVQAGSDECPDLVEDHRHRDEQREIKSQGDRRREWRHGIQGRRQASARL